MVSHWCSGCGNEVEAIIITRSPNSFHDEFMVEYDCEICQERITEWV